MEPPTIGCEFARMLVKSMWTCTHLQCVLAKKNRRIAAQAQALAEQRSRIKGLLDAFDLVTHAGSIEDAGYIAERVLRFDDRKFWEELRRR